MSESWAELDADRLPWLTDDLPRASRRQSRALLFGMLCILLLAGAASWQGGASLVELQHLALGTQPRLAAKPRLEADSFGPPGSDQLAYSPRPDIKPAGPIIEPAVAATAPTVPPSVPSTPAIGQPAQPPVATAPPRAPASASCMAAACGKGDLERLNNALAHLYSQSWSRADAAKRAQLLRTQGPFADRLGSCTTVACKRSAYLVRMRQVSEISRHDWRKPQPHYATDSNLAALNAQLALLYSQSWTRAGAAKRAKLLQTQDRFVARLDECGSAACLNGAYVARMREVSEIMAARG